MAKIKTGATFERGVTEFLLPPEILDKSQSYLGDLRVIAGKFEEMAYVKRTPNSRIIELPVWAALINRGFIPGKEASVTADFHATNIVKNKIIVRTSGANYRRRVMVEGSNNNEDWKVIRDNSFLFHVPNRGNDAPFAIFNEVEFPANNQRYLRITVFNDEDDPERIEIKSVNAFKRIFKEEKTELVPIVSSKVSQKDGITEIELDLGFKNLPLERLELDFSDDNYFRSVAIMGRNSRTRTVGPGIEAAQSLERKVKARWRHIKTGVVSRFSGENSDHESSVIHFNGPKYRYLLIKVYNKDDKPLDFKGARVSRSMTYVDFAPKRKADYRLYFGNPEAAPPQYDFAHYHRKLRAQGVSSVHIGPVQENPVFGKKSEIQPWSERNRWLLWIALILMMAALGFLVYRVAISAMGKTD
jgi:hypothetical protein